MPNVNILRLIGRQDRQPGVRPELPIERVEIKPILNGVVFDTWEQASGAIKAYGLEELPFTKAQLEVDKARLRNLAQRATRRRVEAVTFAYERDEQLTDALKTAKQKLDDGKTKVVIATKLYANVPDEGFAVTLNPESGLFGGEEVFISLQRTEPTEGDQSRYLANVNSSRAEHDMALREGAHQAVQEIDVTAKLIPDDNGLVTIDFNQVAERLQEALGESVPAEDMATDLNSTSPNASHLVGEVNGFTIKLDYNPYARHMRSSASKTKAHRKGNVVRLNLGYEFFNSYPIIPDLRVVISDPNGEVTDHKRKMTMDALSAKIGTALLPKAKAVPEVTGM